PGPTGYYRTDPRADGTIPYFDGLYATSHHRRRAEADEHVSSWPGTPAAPTPTVPYVNRTAPETRHRSHAGARPDAAAPQAGVSLVRHTRQDHHEVSRGSAMTPPSTPRESGSPCRLCPACRRRVGVGNWHTRSVQRGAPVHATWLPSDPSGIFLDPDGLARSGVERHLVRVEDLGLEPDGPGGRVNHVDHACKQVGCVLVAGFVGECHCPA